MLELLNLGSLDVNGQGLDVMVCLVLVFFFVGALFVGVDWKRVYMSFLQDRKSVV